MNWCIVELTVNNERGSNVGRTLRVCMLTAALILSLSATRSLAQIPYEMPPQFQDAPPAVTVPPNTKPLTQEELQRAEALLPLLEGKQEFWAMGEFVHLGESS